MRGALGIAFATRRAEKTAVIHAMHPAVQSVGRSRSRAFTLVEIMIVVVIIGLLAAMGIPAFQRVQRAAQNTRVVNDLRVFSQAFENYNAQHGTWPNNAGPGVVPTAPVSMADDFKVAAWRAFTQIGGRWNWDKDLLPGIVAGVSISSYTCSDAQLAEIDAKIDDGDLTTGLFRQTQSGRATFILELEE